LINPSTIENVLLEEPEEGLMGEEKGGTEKVTQLLAGTVGEKGDIDYIYGILGEKFGPNGVQNGGKYSKNVLFGKSGVGATIRQMSITD
jgi:hypothetical protein